MPLQSPEAEHELVFCEPQESVIDSPEVIDVLEALRSTVGTGAALTVTPAESFAVPPLPLHVRMYVLFFVGARVCEPDSALLPLQSPDALQLVAFEELHERVTDPPAVIELGVMLRFTVGVGGGGGGGGTEPVPLIKIIASPLRS